MDKHSLERLKEAIEQALRDGDLFDEQMREADAEQLERCRRRRWTGCWTS